MPLPASSATMWRKWKILLTWYSEVQALVHEHFPSISMYCTWQSGTHYIQDNIYTTSSAFNTLNLQTWATDWNCHWSNAKPQMIHNILLTREAHSTHDWVNSIGNFHLWDQDHPLGKSQKHFQHPFSINVYTDVIHDQHTVFPTFPHPTGDIYAIIL